MVLLVVLHDDRCAILRNNEMIHEAGGDADGIDGAVQRFMAMTQVTDVLGGDLDTVHDGAAPSPAETSSAASRSELTRDAAPITAAPAASPPPQPAAPARNSA